MPFLEELKRRNVIRMAMFYLVASWALLQVADILFDAFELPTWSMRLLVTVLAIGLVPTLVCSWVFELTPDGIKKEVDIVVDSTRRGTGRKMNVAISVLFALAAGMVAFDRVIPETGRQQDLIAGTVAAVSEQSIAVLPFINISDEPDSDYFALGLSEELLNILAGIPQLQVSARTSSFAFRGKQIDVRTIGEQLNVAHVLEGSVRMTGENLRIAVQLISTTTGFELWSGTFDRTLDHIFEVQREIATETARALAVSMIGETQTLRRTSPEAYAVYLQGLYEYRQAGPENYHRAVSLLTDMLAIDPNYVPAWTVLSSAYSNLALSGEISFDEGHELALQAVERALEVEPDFAYANSAKAWLAMTYQDDYATSAEYFRRALRYSPGNPIILGNAAVLARTLGRLEQAIAMTKDSISGNPVSPVGYVNLADQLSRTGRIDEAIAAAQRALDLAPGSVIAKANLSLAYVLASQPENARDTMELLDERSFYRLYVSALNSPGLGDLDRADQALQTMLTQHAGTRAFYIATIYAWREDIDKAFEWLNRAVNENQRTLGIRTEPMLVGLTQDPRWSRLLSRVGLSDSQVASIQL